MIMRKKYLFLIPALTVFCFLFSLYGQEPRKVGLQQAAEEFSRRPALADALVGIYAINVAGDVLMDMDGERMLVPASNMKLISTGAAMHSLGPDYRYETSIGYDGTVEDGILHGDLYIIGGGDPTLGSEDSIAVPLNTVFKQWKSFVEAAGISRIEGRVIGDGRFFSGMPEEETWLWNDIGTYFGTGVSGLSFYENVKDFHVSPGAGAGKDPEIRPGYPDTPWMTFKYACSTGKSGTGDMLYMYTSDLAPVAEIRGTFAADRAGKTVRCSNKYPEYTCAYYFSKYLESAGIECTGGAGDTGKLSDYVRPVCGDSLSKIGTTYSPELKRIIFETNHASNNFYAETVFRTLGKEYCGDGSCDSSRAAVNSIMKELLAGNISGVRVKDGSGLSRQNYVSPAFFCMFLKAMMDSPSFGDYAATLPCPGSSGTMKYVMASSPAGLKERILLKSGTMDGVRCYSGYVIPDRGTKKETIIFAIMVNNCVSPVWRIQPEIEKLILALAGSC